MPIHADLFATLELAPSRSQVDHKEAVIQANLLNCNFNYELLALRGSLLSYSLLCYGGCEGVKEVPYLASKTARSLDSTSLSGGLITVVVTPQNPGDLAAEMQKSRYNQAVTIYKKMLEFAAKTS